MSVLQLSHQAIFIRGGSQGGLGQSFQKEAKDIRESWFGLLEQDRSRTLLAYRFYRSDRDEKKVQP